MTRTDNLVTTTSIDNRTTLIASTSGIVAAMLHAGLVGHSPNGGFTLVAQAISEVSAALDKIGTAPVDAPDAVPETLEPHTPAVSVRKSLASPDHIISMIDGKPYKTLRRHLTTHGLTPAQYRERYSLKADYPMVAATYSEARRAMAKKIGLGRKPGNVAGRVTQG